MQPLFVIFFTCFHQPFPFQKTNSSLSACFSTNKELCFLHYVPAIFSVTYQKSR